MSGQPSSRNVGSEASLEARDGFEEAHITSLIVRANPSDVTAVAEIIGRPDNAEVHFADPGGKLVVTLETDTLHEVTQWVDRVTALDGVISTTLVYHQIEDKNALDQPLETGKTGPDSPAGEETST